MLRSKSSGHIRRLSEVKYKTNTNNNNLDLSSSNIQHAPLGITVGYFENGTNKWIIN